MNETLCRGGLTELAYATAGPLLALERNGRLLHMNPAAEQLFEGSQILRVTGGMISTRRKEEDRLLRDTLERVCATAADATVCLRSREGVPLLVLDCYSLGKEVIGLRITNLVVRPSPTQSRLRHIFGFTAAEARVGRALVSGSGIQAMAKTFEVDPETVRTQLKRMRSKTGTRSQAQLVGVLASLGSVWGL